MTTKHIIARLCTTTMVIQYPCLFRIVGTNNENKKTNIAVKLPSILYSLDDIPKVELKNRLIKGIVNPAPMDMRIKGDIALKIIFQS